MIKINSLDKALQSAAVSGPKAKVEQSATTFADILSKTSQATAPKQSVAPAIIQPVVLPPLASRHEVYQSTERMLDAMANYQKLLEDRKINLRQVAPAVDQLKKEVDSLEPMIKGLNEKDHLAGIAREAIIVATKEISRFEAGEYVDDI